MEQLTFFDIEEKRKGAREFDFYLCDLETKKTHKFRSVLARQRFAEENNIKKGKCWAIKKVTGKKFMTQQEGWSL